ncbi:hypothetical protein [Breoghania sp.]|uniref:hypothetical protein n=1 Tax=Breoghania sp. TaxID=2065378 RepID=UPI002613772E|nr:hypothetical protein [Breoghania sp.]MDJ0931662.1 hypothetical protein [Breoghania sp.]
MEGVVFVDHLAGIELIDDPGGDLGLRGRDGGNGQDQHADQARQTGQATGNPRQATGK